MITNFLNREQLKIKKYINNTINGISDTEKEQLQRIALGKIRPSDKMLISNNFIGIKFTLKFLYKILDNYIEEITNIEMLLSNIPLHYQKRNNLIVKSEKISDKIDIINSSLLVLGKMLFDTYIPLLDLHFKRHEIIQLLGGNNSSIEFTKGCIDNSTIDSDTLSFIINNIEIRKQRGMNKNLAHLRKWEMPLLNCILNYITVSSHANPQNMIKTSDFLTNIFEGTMVSATFDNEGNIIHTENITPNF